MRIVVLGAGGHARVITDLLERRGYKEEGIELLDDNVIEGSMIFGKRVAGNLECCLSYPPGTDFIIGIGDNRVRKALSEKYHLSYITLVHPQAVIGKNVSLGEGTVVMAGAIIQSGSVIGKHCIVNTGATVDHECKVGDYVHISPGCHVGGGVKIAAESWLGIGSCVKNGIKIEKTCLLGAGGVLVKDVLKEGTYLGVPAKRMIGVDKQEDEDINFN